MSEYGSPYLEIMLLLPAIHGIHRSLIQNRSTDLHARYAPQVTLSKTTIGEPDHAVAADHLVSQSVNRLNFSSTFLSFDKEVSCDDCEPFSYLPFQGAR